MDKIVDHEVLNQLRSFLGKDLDGLVEEFFATAPGQLQHFENALQENDTQLATRIVHTLKSSSGNLGFMVFSTLCRGIEVQLRQGELETAGQWPQALQQALAEAEALLASA